MHETSIIFIFGEAANILTPNPTTSKIEPKKCRAKNLTMEPVGVARWNVCHLPEHVQMRCMARISGRSSSCTHGNVMLLLSNRVSFTRYIAVWCCPSNVQSSPLVSSPFRQRSIELHNSGTYKPIRVYALQSKIQQLLGH